MTIVLNLLLVVGRIGTEIPIVHPRTIRHRLIIVIAGILFVVPVGGVRSGVKAVEEVVQAVEGGIGGVLGWVIEFFEAEEGGGGEATVAAGLVLGADPFDLQRRSRRRVTRSSSASLARLPGRVEKVAARSLRS